MANHLFCPTIVVLCYCNKNIRKHVIAEVIRVYLEYDPMKVFRTTSMDVIAECRYWFGLLEMETLIAKRKHSFMAKYVQSDNVLCQLFAHVESV